jgi:hypothetical protein
MRRMIFVLAALFNALSIVGQVRSSVAARQSYISGEEGQVGIPYVTEGLVAMWDGIWNSGIEEHSAMPEVIKDLVGDHDLTLVYGGYNRGISIGADYFAPNNIYGGKVANYDMNEFSTAIESGEATIEICVHVSGYSGGCNMFYVNDNCRIYSSDNINMRWMFFTSGATSVVSATIDNGSTSSISIRYEGEGNAIYRDGMFIMSFTGGDRKVSDGIEFGRNAAGLWKYHSIRIYNRSLTEEEIELNHLIDRERFGI